MESTILEVIAKGALIKFGTYIANALGDWDSVLAFLIGMMATDYITGLLSPCCERSPTRARAEP